MLIAVLYYLLIASYYLLIVGYYPLIVGYPLIVRNDPLPSVTHGRRSSCGQAYYYIDSYSAPNILGVSVFVFPKPQVQGHCNFVHRCRQAKIF